MEQAVTCGVCSEVYRRGPHDPLVLPCGHTFCRTCLGVVHNTSDGRLTCPNCRMDASNLKLSDLPVCYPLLSLSSSYSDVKLGWCGVHEEEQRYWCQDCQLQLCSLCLYSNHKQGHLVRLAKAVIDDKKEWLGEQLMQLRREVQLGGDEVQYYYNQLAAKVKQVVLLRARVELLFTDMKEASCVEDVLDCEKKAMVLREEQEQTLSHEKMDEILKRMKDMKVLQDTAPENVPEDCTLLRAPQQETPPQRRHEPSMRMDHHEGRLLLLSLASPADGHISLKVPSEVFLELGVGGRCLGRVYISLWWHLRRAQQFLALCTGTMGPSYVGSSFSHVAYLHKPKETLCCKEYWTDGATRGKRDLLTDLEWDDAYAREPQQGLLIPLSRSPDQHGFGICTRGKSGGTFHCPFGEVVAGLEVVQAAVHHHPITEVTISRCGLVLPDSCLP